MRAPPKKYKSILACKWVFQLLSAWLVVWSWQEESSYFLMEHLLLYIKGKAERADNNLLLTLSRTKKHRSKLGPQWIMWSDSKIRLLLSWQFFTSNTSLSNHCFMCSLLSPQSPFWLARLSALFKMLIQIKTNPPLQVSFVICSTTW